MTPNSYTRYLLDTNILVYYNRGKETASVIEQKYGLMTLPTVPLISAVTHGELLSIAYRRQWGQLKCRKLESILSRFITVQLDLPGIYEAYAEIDTYNTRNGLNIGKNDLWIAATAKVTGACLLTTDKDFDPLDTVFLKREFINPIVTL